MIFIIQIFYLVLILICLIASFIVVFHLVRYSYSKKNTALMLIIFSAVAVALLFINVTIFTMLPLNILFN